MRCAGGAVVSMPSENTVGGVHDVTTGENLDARYHLVTEVIHVGVEEYVEVEVARGEQKVKSHKFARDWLGESRPVRQGVACEVDEDAIVTPERIDLVRLTYSPIGL